MTIFGWDASHFDGTLTPAILRQARAEGIAFFSHKIGEGLVDTEGSHDDTALAAARDAGIPCVGGYLVPRSGASVAQQVDFWIRLADAGEPWWRTFPGWFWQIDLERWPYDNVPAAVGIAAAQLLRVQTGRWTILYASRGQYGDQLIDWNGPLWNANYGLNPVGQFAAVYPGDTSSRWDPYSGKAPTFLQYSSSATIAGLTTCDANAYRGTLDQLRAFITGKATTVTSDELLALLGATRIPGTATADHPGDRSLLDVIADRAKDRAIAWGQYDLAKLPAGSPLAQAIARLSAPAAPAVTATQEQVDAAVHAALSDPAVIAALGAAVASHLHVS